MNRRTMLATVRTTVVCLFLLQAVRGLMTLLFGSGHDAVFDQALAVSVLTLDLLLITLAMLTPVLLRRLETQIRPRLLAAALLIVIAGIPLRLEQTTPRLCASLLLIAGAALFVETSLPPFPNTLTRRALGSRQAWILEPCASDRGLVVVEVEWNP